MGDLDAPGVADGPEHRLLVVPPDSAELEAVAPAELPCSGRGDAAVDQDQFEPFRDALTRQVSSISSLARFSCVDAGTTRAPTGSSVTSTATTLLAPFVRP